MIDDAAIPRVGRQSGVMKPVTVQDYMNPASPLYVPEETFLDEYFENESYRDLISGQNTDEDRGCVISKHCGMKVSARNMFDACLHVAIANFCRMEYMNVYDDGDENGAIGYLSGPEFASLLAVVRLHSIHCFGRCFDLNTLTFILAAKNTIKAVTGLTLDEVRAEVEAGTEKGIKALSTALFGSIITRMTGRPAALEAWAKHCHENDLSSSGGSPTVTAAAATATGGGVSPIPGADISDDGAATATGGGVLGADISDDGAGETSTTASQDFELKYPTTDPVDVKSFTDYVLRTCTDSNGRVNPTMKGWTGQGDAASIPLDMKRPRPFCSFIEQVADSIDDGLTKPLVDIARLEAGQGGVDSPGKTGRERALLKVKAFMEGMMQKDSLEGVHFKANQVSRVAVVSFFLSSSIAGVYSSLCIILICPVSAYPFVFIPGD